MKFFIKLIFRLIKLERFRHSELRFKNDTECFDDSGYVIFVDDIIKVTCYGGPDYSYLW